MQYDTMLFDSENFVSMTLSVAKCYMLIGTPICILWMQIVGRKDVRIIACQDHTPSNRFPSVRWSVSNLK